MKTARDIALEAGFGLFAVSSRGTTVGMVMVPARAVRGPHAGKFIVSKTRFARDQIAVQHADELPGFVRRGYGVRMSPIGMSTPSNLFASGSVQFC